MSTGRAIVKMFQKFKTVMIQPRRRCKAILLAATGRKTVREVKTFQNWSFGREFWLPYLQINRKTSPSCQQTVLKVNWKEAFHHKQKRLDFSRRHWNFNWDRVLWSDRTNIELFDYKCSWWVWHRNKEAPNIKR